MTPQPQTETVREYARRVSRFKRVLGVYVQGCEHLADVLTVLEDDYRGMTRGRVYDEEATCLRSEHAQQLDFRLITAADYPDRELGELIGPDWQPVWEREPERMQAARARSWQEVAK